jgi:tricorn protease-like protein
MEHSDREIPRPKPATAGGVRYEAMRNARMRGFEQSGGVVVAIDVKRKTELWALKVYTVTFEPGEEQDTQEVFITELKVDADGKRLTVTNERGERYHVDTATHTVTAAVSK